MSDLWRSVNLGDEVCYSDHYFQNQFNKNDQAMNRRGTALQFKHYDADGAAVQEYDADGSSICMVAWTDRTDFPSAVHVHNIQLASAPRQHAPAIATKTQRNSSRTIIGRIGDMSPERALVLTRQDDGDMIVSIGAAPRGMPYHIAGEHEFSGIADDPTASVEFCTLHGGGGRSPKVKAALEALWNAIEEDNQTSPTLAIQE